MQSIMQPLRDEHRELLPHINGMRLAAEAATRGYSETARVGAHAALDFLDHHLHPHALAEEAVLYPEVARVLGSPDATKTMSRDHVEVAALREELRNAVADDADDVTLARLLFSLHAVVKLHFAKEEEVYLPILEAKLEPAEAKAMYARMEEAAAALHAVA